MKTLTFYFDYLSPFAYFAWLRLQTIQQTLAFDLQLQPVLLAGLLNHWEHKGPAEIPSKRECVYKQSLRYAARHCIAFQFTHTHPFNPLPSLRLTLASHNDPQVIDCIWRTGWVEGQDIGDLACLRQALNQAGLAGDELAQASQTVEVKSHLRSNTEQAIVEQVFGVPSFKINDELFWGNDVLDDIIDQLRGHDLLNKQHYKALLSRGSSASR